jgi:hypothetical protein
LKVKILDRVRNGHAKAEFEALKLESEPPKNGFNEASRPHNYRKNRYGNVLPLDKTRVRLLNTGMNVLLFGSSLSFSPSISFSLSFSLSMSLSFFFSFPFLSKKL